MLVIVVYDIPDNKRRTKLADFLEGHGRRVQLSVFECFMNLFEMQQLYEQILKRVKPEEDNVRFYWIPNDAKTRILTIGSDQPEPTPDFLVI